MAHHVTTLRTAVMVLRVTIAAVMYVVKAIHIIVLALTPSHDSVMPMAIQMATVLIQAQVRHVVLELEMSHAALLRVMALAHHVLVLPAQAHHVLALLAPVLHVQEELVQARNVAQAVALPRVAAMATAMVTSGNKQVVNRY